MKKFLLALFAIIVLVSQNSYGWTTVLYNRGTPWQTYYLGDFQNHVFYFGVNEDTYPMTVTYGIGQSTNGTGWTWRSAEYHQLNGSYREWKSKANEHQFTAIGNWYYSGRFVWNSGGYTEYASDDYYGGRTILMATSYFAVSSINNTITQSATSNTESQISLAWTKNAQNHNVMIVRKKSTESWTEPTQGTAYSVGATLGSGTVVYNGSGTSFESTSLNSSTTYDYKFYSVNNNYYSSGEVASATTQSAVSDYFRSNAVTGEWYTVTTWQSSFDNSFWVTSTLAPTSSSNVSILNGNAISITGAEESNNLTINSGGILNINPTKSLTIHGTLTNSAGVTGLVVKSDASGTGSLIHSTSGVNATVERYISGGWGSADAGWHQISSPVASQAISSFETTGTGNGYDFYGWDELTNMWMNYKDGGFSTWNGGTSFNVGQGYLISYETTQTGKSFTGALNTADVTKTNLSRTGPSTSAGFHLLGNPFASAIKWNDGNWALTDVAGTAKIWNEVNKSYSDIPANGYIPSAQGFMVQVADGTNSITIPVASREHNNTAWYKSTSELERIFLKATENEGGSAQESQVLINTSASEQFDFDFDSRFLAGYAPQFYSTAGGEMLSTNTLPFLAAETVIPFGFVKNDASNFSIELAESMDGYTVYLTDLKNGTEQNLSVNPVYTFTAEAGDDPNRFLLHFGTVGINKPVEDTQVSIVVRDNNLLVSGAAANAEIVVTNLLGQVVLQGKAGNSGLTVISTGSLNDGIYVVSVVSGKQSVSKKISLR